MESTPKRNCSLPASGRLSYVDDYGIWYEVSWETTTSGLDITTVTKQPRVWGQADQGQKRGTILYRRGIITTTRQILVDSSTGYIIRSTGHTQEIGLFQVNFPCGPKPIDPFCYHLNGGIVDDIENVVTCGPRWTDPDELNDNNVGWDDVSSGGIITPVLQQSMQFIDVWSNSENVVSTCP